MADRHTRYNDHKRAVSVTQTRSGSEAIRKRVAQLLGDSGVVTTVDPPRKHGRERVSRRNSPSPNPIHTSSRERHPKPNTKDKPLPVFPSSLSRSLKRKKSLGRSESSDKPENKNLISPSTSSSHFSSFRVYKSQQAESSSTSSHRKIKGHSMGPLSFHPANARSFINSDDSNKHAGVDPDDRLLRGPLMAAEYERMKKEVEILKEELQDARKVSKRHAKKLEDTKSELNAALLALKDKETDLSTLKEKSRTHEELLLTIWASVQCQICMELPANPFALSPCGHVLCLSCLREWFRKAPPALDDMDINPEELGDPHYIIMRTKSCPSCRAVVKHRPVPIFMVKAVVSSLMRSKPLLAGHLASPMEDNESDFDKDNPWKGIFPSSEEESMDEASENSADEFAFDPYSEDEDDDDEGPHELYQRHQFLYQLYAGITSDSDDADESGHDDHDEIDSGREDNDNDNDNDIVLDQSSDEECDCILPRWMPPTVEVDPSAYAMSELNTGSIKLLQRGCSWEMVQNYDISYSHSFGIIVSLHSLNQLYASDDDSDGDIQADAMNRVYLGWNITLENDDHDGDLYMTSILEDIEANPSRWQLTPRRGVRGAMDAKRLVPADEVIEYDSTDMEMWLDADSGDL